MTSRLGVTTAVSPFWLDANGTFPARLESASSAIAPCAAEVSVSSRSSAEGPEKVKSIFKSVLSLPVSLIVPATDRSVSTTGEGARAGAGSAVRTGATCAARQPKAARIAGRAKSSAGRSRIAGRMVTGILHGVERRRLGHLVPSSVPLYVDNPSRRASSTAATAGRAFQNRTAEVNAMTDPWGNSPGRASHETTLDDHFHDRDGSAHDRCLWQRGSGARLQTSPDRDDMRRGLPPRERSPEFRARREERIDARESRHAEEHDQVGLRQDHPGRHQNVANPAGGSAYTLSGDARRGNGRLEKPDRPFANRDRGDRSRE